MNIVSFIFKDLLTKKTRLLLTLLGVSVGIAVCIVMLSLSQSLRASFKDAYTKRKVDIIVYEKDEYTIVTSRIDKKNLNDLLIYPEIEKTTGIIMDLERYKGAYLPVYGWAVDSALFDEIRITQGRMPQTNTHEIIIGEVFANASKKKVGEPFKIKGKNFSIVGVFRSDIPFEKSALIMPIDTMQKMQRNNIDKLMAIYVTVKDEFRNEPAIQTLATKIEGGFADVSAQSADMFLAQKTQEILMGEKFTTMISFVIVIAVILWLSNIMVTAVYEKKKLMGILLALGWRTHSVLTVVFLQSLFIACLGGALGLLIGYYATDYVFQLMDVKLFTPVWNNIFIIKILGIVATTGLFAALIPSWIVMNLNPVTTIKNE